MYAMNIVKKNLFNILFYVFSIRCCKINKNTFFQKLIKIIKKNIFFYLYPNNYIMQKVSILVKSDIFGKKSLSTRKIGPNDPIFQLNSPNTVSNKVKFL
jgi:hypothetical protein